MNKQVNNLLDLLEKNLPNANAFKEKIFNKTSYYQKLYGFDIGTGKHSTWNNEADAFKHAFILNNAPQKKYSVLNDMLLFPNFEEDKNIDVIYYTNDFVKSADGSEKMHLEKEDDSPQIPDPFAEPLLVYGTCMRMKANPNYGKFSYWLNMYKENLANMRSKLCTDIKQSPSITIERI